MADPMRGHSTDLMLRASVDVLFRAVGAVLLHGDESGRCAKAMRMGEAVRLKVPLTAVAQCKECLAYARDRLSVPRDMSFPAARLLRAHLNWAIDSMAQEVPSWERLLETAHALPNIKQFEHEVRRGNNNNKKQKKRARSPSSHLLRRMYCRLRRSEREPHMPLLSVVACARAGDVRGGSRRRAAREVELRKRGEGVAHIKADLRLFGTTGKPRVVLYRDFAGWCPFCERVRALAPGPSLAHPRAERVPPIFAALFAVRRCGCSWRRRRSRTRSSRCR